MFGWLKTACPVDLREKVWTELAMGTLADRWDWQSLRDSAVILPTGEFFELPTGGRPADPERLLTTVCRYVGADRDKLRLEFVPADSLGGGLGEYLYDEVATVRLAHFWQEDLESLIGVLAHYAALDRLLRDGICREDQPDLGWYADLACVFVGMGIFGANSAVKQHSGGDGIWTWWQIRARHQLPARVFGYAMALRAMACGERHPAWAAWLGEDARDTFQRGLRFLQRRGECVLDYEASGALRVAATVPSLAADLTHGGDSTRLASLWALLEHGPAAVAALDEVAACLRSRSGVLQSEAARVIGAIGIDRAEVSDELMSLLGSGDRQVCCSAITALGQLRVPLEREGPRGETFFDELRMLMTGDDVQVAQTAVLTLCRYGSAASEAAETLTEPLRRALIACDYLAQDLYFTALHAIYGDPEAFLRDTLQEYHPDLYPVAVTALAQYREHYRTEQVK
jgi:hypothetical protein